MYGHHGESPLPIVAAYSPSNCFEMAIEAARIALTYRTPVILLSDGYLANGSEPWLLPDVDSLAPIEVTFATEPNHVDADGEPEFWPYLRDPETLARPLALPGTPGLMHRIGGIEKEDGTGNISYDPANHGHMVDLRAAKVAGIAKRPAAGRGDRRRRRRRAAGGRLGVDLGRHQRRRRPGAGPGPQVAQVHLRHLNPFPPNLGDVLARYPRVLVPEMNLGQLSRLLRAEYLVDARAGQQGQGRALHRRRARARDPGEPSMTDTRSPSPPRRTGRATRRCGGARAAATTRS